MIKYTILAEMNLIICVSFCVIIFVTCLSKELKLPHVVSTSEGLLPPCQVPLSSIFPVWKGLFYFSPLDLKQTGGKLLCFVGLCGSCMPVIIP